MTLLLSLVIAFVITAVGLPLARRFGWPALGAVPIATATAVSGALVGNARSAGLTTALVAATGLAAFHLMGDDRAPSGQARFALESAAAIAVVIAGARVGVTAVGALDVALSVVWIVALASAFGLLARTEVLAAGIGAGSGGALFVLAALGGQDHLAGAAGGLSAACLAYLLYAGTGARVRLGSPGAAFVGFILAVAAIEYRAPVARPASLLVPSLLVAVPLLDIAVVAAGRGRRQLALAGARDDDLAHRLAKRGPALGVSVLILVGAQLVLAGLAVAVARSMIAVPVAASVAAAVVLALLAGAARADVYAVPAVGWPRPVRIGALVVATLVIVGTAAAGFSLLRARGPLRSGADTAILALNAARDGDYQRAAALFDESERAFARGRDRLDGPLPALGLALPVVASNIRAARVLARVGTDLATTGQTMATEIHPERMRMQGGAFPLDEIARVSPTLTRTAQVMARAERRVQAARLPYLAPPVRDAVDLVAEKLVSVSSAAQGAAEAARLAPRLLGGDRPRRYFLAIQNSAEARATGGFIGNFGELGAADGRISLEKFGALHDLRDSGVPFSQRTLDAPQAIKTRFADRMPEIKSWLHVNITPDFPTTARMIQSLYPQSGGREVDGVIAVDAVGLAALLKLTGPVEVAGWPVPLTADNIVSVTTREQYQVGRHSGERRDFLGAVAETVWRRVSSSDLGTPYAIADALGPAVSGRHLMVSLDDPEGQRLMGRIGVAGAVGEAPRLGAEGRRDLPTDSLLLVTHNAAGNKLDVYLDRTVSYKVALSPDADGTAGVSAEMNVTLRNLVPSSGLDEGVLGDPSFAYAVKPGENFSLTTVYSPLWATTMLVDRKRTTFRSDAELSQFAHSSFLTVRPRETLTMKISFTGRVRLVDGAYELDLVHQPRLAPDKVSVEVAVPEGWRVAPSAGFRSADARTVEATFSQSSDRALRVVLQPTGLAGLWETITD